MFRWKHFFTLRSGVRGECLSPVRGHINGFFWRGASHLCVGPQLIFVGVSGFRPKKGSPTSVLQVLPGVRSLMFYKVGAPIEGFLTITASKGPLSRVDFLVLKEMRALNETFLAHRTLVRPLSSVSSLMLN